MHQPPGHLQRRLGRAAHQSVGVTTTTRKSEAVTTVTSFQCACDKFLPSLVLRSVQVWHGDRAGLLEKLVRLSGLHKVCQALSFVSEYCRLQKVLLLHTFTAITVGLGAGREQHAA